MPDINENTNVSIATLLKSIRSKKPNSIKATHDLARILIGQNDYTDDQCKDLYEFILRHYISDKQQLDLLLAVSGISEKYRHFSALGERREHYLNSVGDQKTTPDALRMRENKMLEEVAKILQEDLVRGRIPALIAMWVKPTEPDATLPPVEEIFPTAKDIVLAPGEIFQLKVAVIPKEAVNAPLNYVSMDTSVVTVSNTGMLLAHGEQKKKSKPIIRSIIEKINPPEPLRRTTDVIIQAESGVSAKKDITVDGTYLDGIPELDINDFVPEFQIQQEIRIAGTKEWVGTLEANIGDIVEFQIKYWNISQIEQTNVIVPVILPLNMEYVVGSTKLYNYNHPKGAVVNQDTIADAGINIGSYNPATNAYIRFKAKVIDVCLKPGSNTLVCWSQCGVGRVTLQDYAAVIVQKNA